MYAVADIKGFQYRVEQGETIRVPLCDIAVGETLSIPEVLLVSDQDVITVGTPYVEGATVVATVKGHDKYDKVTVFKKKRRKDYSVKRGHRQGYTEIVIDAISFGAAKPAKASRKKATVESPATESVATEQA